jgi:hypothetical protein
LARFWNAQLDLWFRGESLSPRLDEWRKAYRGELQEWAFPEPFIGDLLGSSRIVLLANNPGIAHEELQSREGIFAEQIKEHGFTAWAATRPYDGRESEWEKRYGPIAHSRDRLTFARRFLHDQSLQFRDLLNVELYPWHSLRLTRAIGVQPETLRTFILGPLSELGGEVPVVALAKAWADALNRAPDVVETCERFEDFHSAARRARLYTVREGSKILVAWHSGSDKPPAAEDTELLREIWFEGGHGTRGKARELKDADSRQRGRSIRRRSEAPLPSPGQTTDHSAASRGKPRFDSIDQLAESVKSEPVRSLILSLREWVADEFGGDAVADLRIPGTGQVRLRVLGEAAKIGWDFKQHWMYVWVSEPLSGDLDTLRPSLSNPQSASRTPSGYMRFRVENEADARELQALIRRHIDAARRNPRLQ